MNIKLESYFISFSTAVYSDLLSVRAQAQQWLAEANNGKPSSSSPLPPSSPPISPSQTHATSVSTAKQEKSSQVIIIIIIIITHKR